MTDGRDEPRHYAVRRCPSGVGMRDRTGPHPVPSPPMVPWLEDRPVRSSIIRDFIA